MANLKVVSSSEMLENARGEGEGEGGEAEDGESRRPPLNRMDQELMAPEDRLMEQDSTVETQTAGKLGSAPGQ